jgi:excisionase family DNA binding protein
MLFGLEHDASVRYRASRVNKKEREDQRMLVEVEQQPIAYKPDQAARLMGISERKLDELIATKEIRSFKIGKSRRITHDAITAFIKKKEQEAR